MFVREKTVLEKTICRLYILFLSSVLGVAEYPCGGAGGGGGQGEGGLSISA